MKYIVVVLTSLLLVSCSGTNVYVTGNNNTITAEQLREGTTVDANPITSWGNLQR